MKILSVTDISKRPENQDNYWSAVLEVDGTQVGVLCVCDGMGGLDSGGKASRVLVERIRKHFLDTGTIEGVEDVVEEVNSLIKGMSDKKSGTTCTVLMCVDGSYYVYNVGDSRCYHWSQGNRPEKITEDHTVIQKYKNEGKEITDEIRKKYKNLLTKCVGVMPKVKYDIFTGTYSPGDYFLVCSDGFWHTLEAEDFISGAIMDLNAMVQKCVSLGEVDNITACIISV